MSLVAAPAARTPIVVAERLALVRAALAAALDAKPAGWTQGPVRTAALLPEVHAVLFAEPGALLLLDLGLAAGALGTVRARHPQARILALGCGDDPNEFRRSLLEGADGHISKTASFAALTDAIDRIRGTPAPLAAARLGRPPRPSPPATLTGRQQDVLRLLAEGRSTKDIARALDLAVSTVKVHLAAVYRTFGARNRVEALCRAGCLPPLVAVPPRWHMPALRAV